MKPVRSHRHLRAVALAASALLSAAAPVSAQVELFDSGSIRGYEYTGAYVQFGPSVGQINFDGGNTDSEASGGVTLSGGYRINSWLAADANFGFLGGGDVDVNNINVGEGQYWAITVGPKLYPLGALKAEGIAHFIQPYGLVGLGGGQLDLRDSNFPYNSKDAFFARFILGVDLWATDHFGFFVEGGGLASSEDDLEGIGTFNFGGQYRF